MGFTLVIHLGSGLHTGANRYWVKGFERGSAVGESHGSGAFSVNTAWNAGRSERNSTLFILFSALKV